MAAKGFTHLHLHTQFSLLDGAIPFNRLFDRCKELGMESVAITDHGNMFGVVEFYMQAQAAGIKPIIGIEAYIAPKSRFDKLKGGRVKDNAFHLLLLAETTEGYKNLLKLSSIGYTEGFYYRPRIDKEVLRDLNEGIICTTACIGGEVPAKLIHGDVDGARQSVQEYLDIFGRDRFFIELQKHDSADYPDVNPQLIELAREMDVPLIATNDVHFLNEEDFEAHDAFTCISTGKKVTDPDRMQYPKSVYLKSAEQMRELFAEVPEACDNTLKIAERCNIEIELGVQHAPVYKTDDGSHPDDLFKKLVYEGAEKKYGELTDEIRARIEREIDVIAGKGFASYFLIVWDFCNWAIENRIPIGARGSAVGTVVGYVLGVCDVDPIKYDLLFERFMDPERNEMPDIDIDICQASRQRSLDYVRHKYGEIAQIITFGTIKAKQAIRDVSRVLDVPLDEANRLAKLVPDELKMTLDKALAAEPDLKDAYENNPQTQQVIDIGRKIEGLTRHSSVHACGVVIADEPLTNFLPLYKAPGSDDLITQFEGPIVEKVGLLKMDFLGLKTLSVLARTRDLIKENHDVDIVLEKIDIADQKVFKDVFGAGKTSGVFQFESGGMQDLLMKLKPDRLEDLIAANALYRPGPMALIPDYIERKHGADWEVPHPIMREVLEETFGIMVYQEQVMRICNRLGGIKLREAYALIKAIGKKKEKVIAAKKKEFIDGCVEKGLTEQQGGDIFALIEKFAGYGFNKSHATRYSFVAYQTAWLKYYYPVEFMAALLTYEMGNTDKVVDYIQECKVMGIEILPPDVNESCVDFTVVYKEVEDQDGQPIRKEVIRFGLAAVKGVGERAVEQIIEARQKIGVFKNLFHFCENVDLRAVNKQVIEALIKAGAFDSFCGNRAQMIAGLETAMQNGSSMQADLQSGQMNFFGDGGFGGAETKKEEQQSLPNISPWPELQMLAYEKEVLGFYVTSNPLSKHAEEIDVYSTTNTSRLKSIRDGAEVLLGGMVTKIRNIVTKSGKNPGQKMAVFELEDPQGRCEVVLFPKAYDTFGVLIEVDKVVFVRGKVDTSREMPNILCDEVVPINEVADKMSARINLKLLAGEVTEEKINTIRSLCMQHRGSSQVRLNIRTPKGFQIIAETERNLNVRANVNFVQKMKTLVGHDNVELCRK